MVLDEADEMLNMGFLVEVEDILKSIPESKRMLLFSATMPPEILKLTRKFMRDYELVEVKSVQLTTDLIDQMFFEVRHADRFEALCRIIDTEPEFYGIVFCRTKVETDEVANKLVDRGFDAEAIHGDVTQFQRELILKKFKYKKVNILVATDVAARGLDITGLPFGRTFFIVHRDKFRHYFEQACKRAGIKGFRFHDLRACSITNLFLSGMAVPEVALISGHKTWSQLRRYTRIKPEQLLDKINNVSYIKSI
jgi:hypothetical protein